MTIHKFKLLPLALALATLAVAAADHATAPSVCADCIRQNLTYLAGPELHGRGSGTADEFHAAQYIAAQLQRYGLAPAAGNGQYIQAAIIQSRTVTSPPILSFGRQVAGRLQTVTWTHGKEIAVYRLSNPDVTAPLQKLDLNDPHTSPRIVKPGAAVLLKLKAGAAMKDTNGIVAPYLASPASLVIVAEEKDAEPLFKRFAGRLPPFAKKVSDGRTSAEMVIAKPVVFQQLWNLTDGAPIKLRADVTPWQTSRTWNVLAKIGGTRQRQQIILLSAHLDHLGVRDGKTYPGADDDASGTVAVMELARALAQGPRPDRTIMVALWGSEEQGLVGARYFLKHPSFEVKAIVANLEFEMIGRADPKVKPEQLWLTGWERSDLGPTLAAHGAQLVGDPHPDQKFFTRSDNYALARTGVIAQTVSSYGLHQDYHQPTDTLDKIDWQHLDSAIGSMIAPVRWLANSDFTPKWKAGMNRSG